jgi:hypothetical protein
MKCVSLSAKENTPAKESSLHLVTVTYREHPLMGQTLELVDVVRCLDDEDTTVILRLQNGNVIRLPFTYTNCKPSHIPRVSVLLEDTPHSLSMEGLRRMVKIINSIRHVAELPDGDGRLPAAGRVIQPGEGGEMI